MQVKNSCSIKVKMRPELKKDGTALVYIQSIINKKVFRISLDFSWPPNKFNETDYCLKRDKNDTEYNDKNLIIRKSVGRINEIFVFYRLTNQILTPELFENEYHNPLSKVNFIEYFEKKMNQRYNDGEIMNRSWKNHRNTLNKLRDFRPHLLFNLLNGNFPQEFDRYLKNKCALETYSGRWSHHKDVKTYLRYAKLDKITFTDPYENFKVKNSESKWRPLEKSDVFRLYYYYQILEPGTTERRVLQRFLGGGCLTGLRISDQRRVKRDQIVNGTLALIPYKTRSKGKLLVLPLLDKAIELMEDSMRENECETIFYDEDEVVSNRILKTIAKDVGIKKNIHHHVGRETFGTLYIEMGGDVTSLQKYFDHYKISTTMKYVHIGQKKIQEDLKKMNGMLM